MGILGRYLDLLPITARERLFTATRWTTGVRVDQNGRDILGHAEDWRTSASRELPEVHAAEIFSLRHAAGDDRWTNEPRIPLAFERLANRIGLDAAVSLVKQRLAAPGRACRSGNVRRGRLRLLR